MSEEGIVETPAGSNTDRDGEAGALVATGGRALSLSSVDTSSITSELHGLFDRVMSGQPYNEGQVRSATNLTNTMIKVLRFEFDVYKHFSKDPPKRPGPKGPVTIAAVAEYLRHRGDRVEKGKGIGQWVINDRHCEESDLITRANNIRSQRGEKPFKIDE